MPADTQPPVRLGVVDDSNVAMILVVCAGHARQRILSSPGVRYHAAEIRGATSRVCALCAGGELAPTG